MIVVCEVPAVAATDSDSRVRRYALRHATVQYSRACSSLGKLHNTCAQHGFMMNVNVDLLNFTVYRVRMIFVRDTIQSIETVRHIGILAQLKTHAIHFPPCTGVRKCVDVCTFALEHHVTFIISYHLNAAVMWCVLGGTGICAAFGLHTNALQATAVTNNITAV